MRLIQKFSGRPLSVVPLVICAGALAFAGCGDDSDDEGESASGATTSESAEAEAASDSGGEVTILDFKYDPDATTVPAGTEVVWTNDDMADHTATADDDSFDTGVFGKGEEGKATLDEPGTYAYHCDLHPFMKGEIVVE